MKIIPHKIILIIITIIILYGTVYAQVKGTVTGTIKMEDGTVLPGVTVWIEHTQISTVTNAKGIFTLSGITPGTARICASLDNFQAEATNVFVPFGKTVVQDFTLKIRSLAEEALVIAERPMLSASDKVSKVTLTPRQIESLPSLGEKDIFRAFQLLPGISGSNESSSGLYIRGGKPDQNLVLYDGFTIYHVDHLFGYFSAFNMEALDEANLSKGGFEAKYGGRTSSVMELIGRSGDSRELKFGAGLSMLSANALAEIPLFGKGSLLLAARRSFASPLYNNIADMFSASNGASRGQGRWGGGRNPDAFQSEPSSYFYDLNGRINLNLWSRDQIVLSFYNGKDDLDNSRDMTTPPFMEERGITMEGEITDITEWGNTGISFSWERYWHNIFQSNLTLAYSDYFNNRDRTNNTTITITEELETDKPFFRGGSFARGSVENNDLTDYTLRWDNTLLLGQAHEIDFGLQLTENSIIYDFEEDDTAEEEEGSTIETPPRRLVGILEREDHGRSSALYIQDRWTLLDRFTLVPGFRATYFDVTDKWYSEPRLAFQLQLSSKFKLKGAWGKYFQFTNRITREDVMQGNREFWTLADAERIPVSEAQHYIGGIAYETADWLLDVEAYFKNLDGLTEFATRFVRPEEGVDYNQFFFQGTGTAQGLEFLLQKKTGALSGWLSYTLGKVEYEFPALEEDPFPALHDQTHEFKLVGIYEVGSFIFSGTWIFASGRPYTEPVGVEEIEVFAGRTREQVVIGEKNGARLPAYHRLDLSATYKFRIGDADSKLGATLFNSYDNTNVWYKEFDVVEGEIIENDFTLMGFTFNLFFNIRF